MTPEVIEAYNPLPVGVSRPNTSLFTTDEGELVIKGNSVSLGYLDNKEKPMRYLTLKMDFVYIIRVIKPSRKMDNGSFKEELISKLNLTVTEWNWKKLKRNLDNQSLLEKLLSFQYIKNNKVIHLIGAVVPTEEVRE